MYGTNGFRSIVKVEGVITALATIVWNTMRDRLAAQDRITAGLRADIERMLKGCGLYSCQWWGR